MKDKLKKILIKLIPIMQPTEGTLHNVNFPEMDYYALDYLAFAELNLAKHSISTTQLEKENELISCVSNLKRALDCSIECFFHSWNLNKSINKANLGMNKKLEILKEIGLFSSRTIERFIKIRNKVEHEFKKPDLLDLEALFDLVNAFVSILQNITNSGFKEEVDCEVYDQDTDEYIGMFNFSYDKEKLSFRASWGNFGENIKSDELVVDIKNHVDFFYYFRVLYFLNLFDSFGNIDHFKNKLELY